ncbi:non-ribosomal peptide synthetase [Micromonospora sp. NPDC048871]|uniref:non-ribosomal peptide synthetase n=1 Tax=unclassified Micromonospora TaxID=2617518 RepID=UPI002E152184|nr:non-ribosomal peptide synthetase [Micromonospora sp. NBC_01739]
MNRDNDAADQNVACLVQQWAAVQPAAPAACDGTSSVLTYAQLWERAGEVADQLAGGGVAAGEYVAVRGPRSLDLLVAVLGIVRAGAAYVPLDAHAPAERIGAILDETAARAVVDVHNGALTVEWTRQAGHLGEAGASRTRSADDPIYVAYTSGSTGRPKGVVIPHRAVRRLVLDQPYCPLAPGDRVANSSNPAFDATTFEIWSTWCAGATVVVLPALTDLGIESWVEETRRLHITTMFLTTSLFHAVARERPDAFRSVRDLLVGGEQMEIGAARAVLASDPPKRLINAYGPTETTTFASFFTCTPATLNGLDQVPVGFALENTDLSIVDENGHGVSDGEVGELWIGGPGVATGYLGQDDLTAQRFVSDPRTGRTMYRTGDLARRRSDGAVELLGRRDRQVKMRGYRIELEEIERAATGTGLAAAAFVERVGEGPSAMLVGFVLPPANASVDLPGLTEALSRRLPDYMVPARWVELTHLPVGPTGKVDRDYLRALLDADARELEPTPEVDDPVLQQVRVIWREVLGRPGVSPGDNFIDLGGNSILAVQVMSRLQQQLSVEVEAADVLLADSMADLARSLRSGARTPLTSHLDLQRESS